MIDRRTETGTFRTPLLCLCSTLLILMCSVPGRAQDIGTYTQVRPAQPTRVAEGQVEVVEAFSYACHSCNDFEPYMRQWSSQLPEDVVLRRLPMVFHSSWEPLARAYYIAEKLGILEDLHPKLFHAVFVDNKPLVDEETIKDYFAEQGVDGAKFSRLYHSNEINIKIRESMVMAQKYKISATPEVIVNGKYLVGIKREVPDYRSLLQVVDQLVARERKP